MPIYLSCNYCGKKIVPEFTDSKTLTLPGTAFLESNTGRFPGGIFCSHLCHDDLSEAFDEWEKENGVEKAKADLLYYNQPNHG